MVSTLSAHARPLWGDGFPSFLLRLLGCFCCSLPLVPVRFFTFVRDETNSVEPCTAPNCRQALQFWWCRFIGCCIRWQRPFPAAVGELIVKRQRRLCRFDTMARSHMGGSSGVRNTMTIWFRRVCRIRFSRASSTGSGSLRRVATSGLDGHPTYFHRIVLERCTHLSCVSTGMRSTEHVSETLRSVLKRSLNTY
jgi:hypothetical protein